MEKILGKMRFAEPVYIDDQITGLSALLPGISQRTRIEHRQPVTGSVQIRFMRMAVAGDGAAQGTSLVAEHFRTHGNAVMMPVGHKNPVSRELDDFILVEIGKEVIVSFYDRTRAGGFPRNLIFKTFGFSTVE